MGLASDLAPSVLKLGDILRTGRLIQECVWDSGSSQRRAGTGVASAVPRGWFDAEARGPQPDGMRLSSLR